MLKREVVIWGQGGPLEEGSKTQEEPKRLMMDLSALGMQGLHKDMEEGNLPTAATEWSLDLEAEAAEILVERISTGIWRTLFKLYKGKHCFFLNINIGFGNKRGLNGGGKPLESYAKLLGRNVVLYLRIIQATWASGQGTAGWPEWKEEA